MKRSTKLLRWISKAWTKWKVAVDFVKANQVYFTAMFFLMTVFGIIAPDTATSLRDALVGALL